MTTLAEIQKKIKELQKQSAKIVAKEKRSIIAGIKQKITDYQITALDLGFSSNSSRRKKSAHKTKKSAVAKYRNEAGKTWSGGRGRKPQWVKAILDKGGDIEKYRIR